VVQIGDSAYPLAAGSYPGSVQGWGFYIGGDTPHVWSDTEVAALPYRYRLPIFTRSDPDSAAQAQSDAAAAVAWAKAHHQPAGTLIQLDFETAVNAVYVTAFDAIIVAGGYKTVLYGSQSTVQQNPTPSGGFNIANWDGVDDDPNWTAKQYEDTGGYDLNDFSPAAPLWDTQAAAQAPADPQEVEMITFSVGTDPANPSVNQGIWLLSGGLYVQVDDTTTQQALLNAGIKQAPIDFGMHQAIQAAIKAQTAQIYNPTISVPAPAFPAFQLTGTATPQVPAAG
jgi:hypothetical protein